MTNVHPLAVTAEPPQEMTREDRRIVFAKLSEVYLDESKGYSDGWTDKRIAEDLACPRAWVENVREEMFGPAKTNEDITKALAEWRGVQKQIEALGTEQARLSTEIAQVRDKQKALSDIASRIARHVEAIERAVLP